MLSIAAGNLSGSLESDMRSTPTRKRDQMLSIADAVEELSSEAPPPPVVRRVL